jgi:hypothetical protein
VGNVVIKTYVLKGTASPGATSVELDKLSTPSKVTRTLIEVRYYCSLPADTQVTLMLGTETVYTFEAQVNDYYKLPYPANLVTREGDEIRLVATNRNTTTSSTVKVELVVEETVSR